MTGLWRAPVLPRRYERFLRLSARSLKSLIQDESAASHEVYLNQLSSLDSAGEAGLPKDMCGIFMAAHSAA